MRRNLLALLLCAYCIQPAFAGQWLVFNSGQTSPCSVYTGNSAPVPGTNVASDATVLVWTIQNNDNNPQNYQLQNGAIVYSPPTAPVPDPNAPNVTGFITALRTDQTFTSAIRAALVPWYAIFQADLNNPTALQQDWSDLTASNSAVITSSVQTTILNYASTYNIPLVSH